MNGVVIHVIETPSLGDRTYVVHDGTVAFVIDPQRDIDRVLALLESEDVRPTHVLETHIHNDYVTGGLALARATGAAYLVNGDDDVSFDRIPIRDGESVEVGAAARDRHTGSHVHALVLRIDRWGRPGRGLHRRLTALRRDRPARPVGR